MNDIRRLEMVPVTLLVTALVMLSPRSFAIEGLPEACSQPVDSGRCYILFLAWHYDQDTHECRQFIYRGCGGNYNRFPTEEECYKHCAEKMIPLKPPTNLTVGLIESTEVYLFWYPPETYFLHNPTTNVTNETGVDLDYDEYSIATKVDVPYAVNNQVSNSDTKGTSTPAATTTKILVHNVTVTNETSVQNSTTKSSTNSPTGSVSSTALPKVTTSPSVVANSTGDLLFVNGTFLNITEYANATYVPFHFAKLKHYLIQLTNDSGSPIRSLSVNDSVMEYKLEGLEAGTKYQVVVSAVYITGKVVAGVPAAFSTLNEPSTPGKCFCDPYGTVNGRVACNTNRTQGGFCTCNPTNAGLFCELCAHKYYRLAPSMPCHRCPCSEQSSTGSCHFVEGYLHCLTCRQGYAGNLCHRCANGYYRDFSVNPSRCRECGSCPNISPALICDPFDGTCKSCHFNTTGNYCDRCLDGFEGDPLKNIPCTPVTSTAPPQENKHPTVGIIAAIVVVVLLALGAVFAFIMYKRSRNFPANKPFWSIEFKESHDDVNFSAVPEDELERQREEMDEERKHKKYLPKYRHLHEDA